MSELLGLATSDPLKTSDADMEATNRSGFNKAFFTNFSRTIYIFDYNGSMMDFY